MKQTPTLATLASLEKTIVTGLLAYEKRNELIAALVADGTRQADVARCVNAVRKDMGAPMITPDAIAATIKRVERKAAGERGKK